MSNTLGLFLTPEFWINGVFAGVISSFFVGVFLWVRGKLIGVGVERNEKAKKIAEDSSRTVKRMIIAQTTLQMRYRKFSTFFTISVASLAAMFSFYWLLVYLSDKNALMVEFSSKVVFEPDAWHFDLSEFFPPTFYDVMLLYVIIFGLIALAGSVGSVRAFSQVLFWQTVMDSISVAVKKSEEGSTTDKSPTESENPIQSIG